MMKGVVIYTRRSDSPNPSSRESIESQTQFGKQWVERNGNTVVDVIEDYESGNTGLLDRKEGRKLKEYIEEGVVDVVWCTELDRLQRNLRESIVLRDLFEENGILIVQSEYIFDWKDESSLVLYSLMSTFAELERKRIVKRNNRGKTTHLERKILPYSKVLYGYMRKGDGTPDKSDIIEHPVEGPIVRDLFDMFRDKEWNSINEFTIVFKDKHDINYSNDYIRIILSKNVEVYYKGIIKTSFKEREYSIPVPSLIDEKTYRIVRDKYSKIVSRRRFTYRRYDDKEECINDLLYCGTCGNKLMRYNASKTSKEWRYRCYNYKKSGLIQIKHSTTVSHPRIVQIIRDVLKDVLTSSKIVKTDFIKSIKERTNEDIEINDIKDLKRRISKSKTRTSELIRLLSNRPQNGEIIEKQLDEEDKLREFLENDLKELEDKNGELISLKESIDWNLEIREVYGEERISTIGEIELFNIARKYIEEIRIEGKQGRERIVFQFKLPIIADKTDIDRKDYKLHKIDGGTWRDWEKKFVNIPGSNTLIVKSMEVNTLSGFAQSVGMYLLYLNYILLQHNKNNILYVKLINDDIFY